MRTKTLLLLLPPLLLLTGCGEETATAPHTAQREVLDAQQEAISYALTPLDGLWTQTTGINDAGTVVGRKLVGREVVDERSDGEEWEAALWNGGVATTVGIPRSTFVGINRHGVALGLEKNEDYSPIRGFLYDHGAMAPISGEHLGDWAIGDEYLTGSLEDDRVFPVDINDSEVVIARGAAWMRRSALPPVPGALAGV